MRKKGQRNLFIACEPLGGKRYLKVTQRRTKKDWASFIEELLTVHYPTASKVILVMDNLNTHPPASLYDTFPPAKAKQLLDRLEIHDTRHPCVLAHYRGNRMKCVSAAGTGIQYRDGG